jgi:hypothetical protein
MDIEFHYYITALIALRAGFSKEEAYILAYASQHVDDNTDVFKIDQGTAEAYSNYISQTSNILKAEKELMQIYPVFHFMPGNRDEIECEGAMRCDGKLHVLNTIPDNSNACAVLQAAFDDANLYRIGIATHMYADTFAHQNFVGYYESFNAMKGVLGKAIPDVGHADAKHDPDLPGLIWDDKRLINKNKDICNRDRFLKAAERLFELYRRHKNPHCPSEVITADKASLSAAITHAIGETGGHAVNGQERKNRIARYRKAIGEDFKDYDEKEWFGVAIERKGFLAPINPWPSYAWKADHTDSHWFKFQEAVKNHQWFAKDNVLGPITGNLQLDRFNN